MSDSDADNLPSPTDSAEDAVTTEATDDNDHVTEAGPGWSGRMGNAIAGVLFALILLPGSVVLLGWNENRAVHTARSLAEGARVVREAAVGRVDPAEDGKLVHVSGPLTVPGTLADPEFSVQAPNAAVLRRAVETYQWKEERQSNRNNSTTYSYSRVWSESIYDSSQFHQESGHHNRPPHFTALTLVAPEGSLGARKVSEALLRNLHGGDPLRVAEPPSPGMRLDGEAVYIGADPARPQVGDQRVRWTVLHPAEVSVIAQQEGDRFAPYQTGAGDRLYMISPGVVAADAMIHKEEVENALLAWGLRAVGAVMMFFGFCLLLWPVAALGSLLPFAGELLGAGIMLVSGMLTVVATPLVIGIAWLAVRPLVGAVVLLAGFALGYALLRMVRARRLARAPGTPFAPAAPVG